MNPDLFLYAFEIFWSNFGHIYYLASIWVLVVFVWLKVCFYNLSILTLAKNLVEMYQITIYSAYHRCFHSSSAHSLFISVGCLSIRRSSSMLSSALLIFFLCLTTLNNLVTLTFSHLRRSRPTTSFSISGKCATCIFNSQVCWWSSCCLIWITLVSLFSFHIYY